MKLYVQTKKAQNVFVTFMKSERRKNNCSLVFGNKNDVFPFFKKEKYLARLGFAQEARVSLKEPQNNRRLTE